MDLYLLKEVFCVCQLKDLREVNYEGEFVFVGKTDDEISYVCEKDMVPEGTLKVDDGWRAFKIGGTLEFSMTGVISGISAVLAETGVPVFVISTYNTDYVLVKSEYAVKAADILREQYSVILK